MQCFIYIFFVLLTLQGRNPKGTYNKRTVLLAHTVYTDLAKGEDKLSEEYREGYCKDTFAHLPIKPELPETNDKYVILYRRADRAARYPSLRLAKRNQARPSIRRGNNHIFD